MQERKVNLELSESDANHIVRVLECSIDRSESFLKWVKEIRAKVQDSIRNTKSKQSDTL